MTNRETKEKLQKELLKPKLNPQRRETILSVINSLNRMQRGYKQVKCPKCKETKEYKDLHSLIACPCGYVSKGYQHIPNYQPIYTGNRVLPNEKTVYRFDTFPPNL